MEDKERANMVLKRIGEMPYFDPEAIVKVLVNEFELIRKEAAQHSAQSDKCPSCAGTGRSAMSDPAHDCYACNGTGIRR
jgi:hypothetical protein